MLRTIYLGFGSVCLLGYLGWSIMGMELGGGRDPIPRVPSVSTSRTSSGYGGSRSSGGFFGSGGGFGK